VNNDSLDGGEGADILVGGTGSNTLTGGSGADTIVATLEAGSDTVIGFVVGQDLIDVTAFGATGTIVQSGSNTLITFANGRTMVLKNVVATTVTNDSFVGLSGPSPDEPERFVFTADKPAVATPLADDHSQSAGLQGREDGLFAADLGRPDFERGASGHFWGPRGLPEHDWIV